MGKAMQEMYIVEDNVGILRDIVKKKSMMPVKFSDGIVKVDLFTASAVVQVLDKVNPANREKITKMINTGKKSGFSNIANIAFKAGSKREETDLDEGFINIGGAKVKDDEESLNEARLSLPANVEDVRMTTLIVLLGTAIVNKTKKLPGTAPLITQLLDSKNEIENELKSKMKLTGMAAVKEFSRAMEGHFTSAFPPLSTMAKKYRIKTDYSGRLIFEALLVYRKKGGKDPISDDIPSHLKKFVSEDLDEGKMSQLHQYIKDKKSPEEIAKMMKLDVKTVKALMSSHHPEDVEESAASDARRAMSKDKDFSRRDSADDDTDATDADIKGASKNIIMQLRKAGNRASRGVEFADGKKVQIPAKMALAVQQKYNSLKRPADKEKFQAQIAKSYKDMLNTLKSGYGEQKESILDRMNRKIKENKNG